jgi:TatD DNase family protein
MDHQFADDLDAVLARARSEGVGTIVCVGFDLASSRAAVALAERHAEIFATVGVHPNSCAEASPSDFDEIELLSRHPRVVGIGETGLDNYRHFSPAEMQLAWLRRHLALAAERGLPVVVHCREAADAAADELAVWAKSLPPRARPPGVLHCFGGDSRLAERCLEAGFLVSFAGPLTFKRDGALIDAARRAPAERVVVETDCPYLAPAPKRGRRNEPAWVRFTFERLAEVRGEDPTAFAAQLARNAERLFGFSGANVARSGETP